MSELVVVGFKKDLYRAAAVLSELRERNDAWTANLHSAVAAYRNAAGELTVDQAYESTEGESTIANSMLGSLLGIALAALTLPLTGGASAVVAAAPFVAGALGGSVVGAHHGHRDVAWWKTEVGIPDSFLNAIRELVQPGDSAILFLLRKPDPDDLQERFRSYGGTVIRAQLDATQTATLQAQLTGKSRS